MQFPPSVWGPFFWHTIHIVALGYPKSPTYTDKKCAKEFYESLTLYHNTKETNQEVYIPVTIAEPTTQENIFSYAMAEAELIPEVPIEDIKIIRL